MTKKYRVLKNKWNVSEGIILEFVKEDRILEDVWHMKCEEEYEGEIKVFRFALPKYLLQEIQE